MVKTVAIIGCGASGLGAVKCCLDEGLEPTCFEKAGHIGGLWHYTPQVEKGRACVMKCTVTNVSKEMMTYSDFPPPRDMSIYMHNTEVDEYFHLYADAFGLKKHIRLNTEVLNVEETDSGQWEVTVKPASSETRMYTFDAVMVATGIFSTPLMPHYPGMETFKGKLIHSHEYKHARNFEDKRVLVVGIGNSAGDAATELSLLVKQVYLSTRTGAWVMSRLGDNGVPLDMQGLTRVVNFMMTKFPTFTGNVAAKRLNKKMDHKKYELQPAVSPLQTGGFVNDDFPSRLLTGSIKIKPDVKCFTENCIEFTDGSKLENIDVVIFGTGYTVEFPFLKQGTIPDDNTLLYKSIFPPDPTRHTLAMIGCQRTKGPVIPVMEMQCRFAVQVFKGAVKLPSRDAMMNNINEKIRKKAVKHNSPTSRLVAVTYVPYMDELAVIIGCKPNIAKLMLTDRALARACLLGPCSPYQYRLTGPGCWAGAREAILTMWDRTYYPLRSGRTVPRDTHQGGRFYKRLAVLIMFAAFGVYYIYR